MAPDTHRGLIDSVSCMEIAFGGPKRPKFPRRGPTMVGRAGEYRRHVGHLSPLNPMAPRAVP
eukprot:1061708-Prymnesium_polylepis.2